MTKEEFEKYVAAHPDQKDALQGLFTVVRRDGDEPRQAIPYSHVLQRFSRLAAQRFARRPR